MLVAGLLTAKPAGVVETIIRSTFNTLTRRTFDRAGQLASYDAKVFDLIPLHRWDDAIKGKNGNPKKVGKAPIDNDWTIRPYTPQ
jgi:hypothetical protein